MAVALEQHVAAYVDFPEVHRRVSVADPLGGDLAHASCRLQPDGVEPGSDKTIAQFRGRPQVVAHIRGKALGTTEKLLDARLLKGGQALHGIVQHRFEMFEVTGDFIKAKVFADALHAPGPGAGFEGPDQQFARVVLVVGTGIVVPQHRQIGMQTRDRLEQHVVMLAGVQGQGDTHRGGQIPGPHAAANHHVAGLDIPGGGANPRGFAPLLQDGVYPGVGEDPRPPAARPLARAWVISTALA